LIRGEPQGPVWPNPEWMSSLDGPPRWLVFIPHNSTIPQTAKRPEIAAVHILQPGTWPQAPAAPLGTRDPCRFHATASWVCLLRSTIKLLSSSSSSGVRGAGGTDGRLYFYLFLKKNEFGPEWLSARIHAPLAVGPNLLGKITAVGPNPLAVGPN